MSSNERANQADPQHAEQANNEEVSRDMKTAPVVHHSLSSSRYAAFLRVALRDFVVLLRGDDDASRTSAPRKAYCGDQSAAQNWFRRESSRREHSVRTQQGRDRCFV